MNLRTIFKFDYFILIALCADILCSIIWFYPYSLPLKTIILLYGLSVFFLHLNVGKFTVTKEVLLFIMICLCALCPALINFKSHGFRGVLFFFYDIVIFFVIYSKVRAINFKEQKILLEKIAKIYVFISFFISLISLPYLFCSGPQYYLPDGYLASILKKVGMFQNSSEGFIYGISNSYLVGIASSSHGLGNLAYYSLVFTMILGEIYKRNKNLHYFLIFNFIIQIITEISTGMRTMYLGVTIFFVLYILAWKVRVGQQKGASVIFFLIAGVCAAILVIGVSAAGKSIQNISDLEVREISEQTERIAGEWEEPIPSRIRTEKFDGSVYAYNIVKQNRVIMMLDALSTTRIRIWISAVFELAERYFMGNPANTVEVIIQGNKTNIDFHSAYFRTLGIYGLIGATCFFIMLYKIFNKCYKIILKKIKANKIIFAIASAILTQFVMALFGGGFSGSLNFQIVIFWFFSAIIFAKKY